jgi:acetylxylan esterase
VAVLVACLALASPASAAALQEVTDFGDNPSGIKMFLYVPDNVAAHPAILVGVHWCHGTAQDFYAGTRYAALADQYGFIVVYPSAVSSDGCWDVHSDATLTHGGGGDSGGIVSMVEYVEQQYNGDRDRVYVTGISSGAMMTNVLLGAYPEVFQAGSAYAGVPFGCFAGTDSWNTACATGQIIRTGPEWGDLVRAADPGFTGTRPRMQLWHGSNDETLNFANFGEEIKQWTDVAGVSATPTTTEQDFLQAGLSGFDMKKWSRSGPQCPDPLEFHRSAPRMGALAVLRFAMRAERVEKQRAHGWVRVLTASARAQERGT